MKKNICLKKQSVDSNRNKLKKVIVTNIETGLETVYSLIYKSSGALECSTTQNFFLNGQLLKDIK